MKPGTQILYMPAHALAKVDHPGVLHGFIASEHKLGQSVYVHFWQADAIGVTLRQAGAVLTDSTRLIPFVSCDQSVVDALLGQQGKTT